MCSTVLSASAVIVAKGLAPSAVGITAASVTMNPGYVSNPWPVKSSPYWLVPPVSPVPSRAIQAPLQIDVKRNSRIVLWVKSKRTLLDER